MLFGITPPGCQCDMEKTAFNVFAYHQQKIEDFINELVKTPNDTASAAKRAGINLFALDYIDILYIETEVNKRL